VAVVLAMQQQVAQVELVAVVLVDLLQAAQELQEQ
jgi:hypothetical protein